jgi:hypothetical protein
MTTEIQKQNIRDAQSKVNGLKYSLGYARHNRTDQVEWLEGELAKAEQKLAKLEKVA